MNYATLPRVAKSPGEIVVGDIAWDGTGAFEVAEVNHSTDGTVPVVELVSTEAERWKIRSEGGVSIAVVDSNGTAAGNPAPNFSDDFDELEEW